MLRRHLLILALYTILAIISTYPLIFEFSSLLGPPEDNQLFVWNLWWFKFSIFNLHSWPFWTGYLFYPEGASLYLHTFTPLNCLISLPLQATFGPIPAYNLLMMLTFVLTGYSGYLLCRHFEFSRSASFLGGQVMAFNPFHFAHAGHHLNICSTYLLPITLLWALRAKESGRRTDIAIAGILFGANYYLDFYMFAFATIMLVLLILFSICGKARPSKPKYKNLVWVAVIGTAIALPLVIPAFIESTTSDFSLWSKSDEYVADLVALVVPHSYHWLNGIFSKINARFIGNPWEAAVFLGYVILPLSLWSIFRAKFTHKWLIIVIGLSGLLLSFGDNLHLLGNSIEAIKLPGYIFDYIPVLDAIRSPSRFIFLTYFSLGVLFAAGADKILNDLRHKKRTVLKFVPVFASLFIVIDYGSIPFEMTKINIPLFYRSIKAETGDFSIINFPFLTALANERHMYYQTIHNKPISGGMLARFDPNYYTRLMSQPLGKPYLISRKIKYMVLHGEQLSRSDYQGYFEKFAREFELLKVEYDQALFKVY